MTMTREQLQHFSTPIDFEALFDSYYPKLYRYVRYQVCSRKEAEHLTFLALERVFESRTSYDPSREAFSTWIFRIARNWIINYQTQQRRNESVSLDDLSSIRASSQSPESVIAQKVEVEILLEHISTLPADERDVVAMKFGSRMQNWEIAEALDLTEKMVGLLLLSGLRMIKEQIEESYGL